MTDGIIYNDYQRTRGFNHGNSQRPNPVRIVIINEMIIYNIVNRQIMLYPKDGCENLTYYVHTHGQAGYKQNTDRNNST